MWRLLRWLALAGVIAFAVAGRPKKTTVHEVDDNEPVRSEELREFIAVLSRVNDESDPEYSRALENLRGNSAEVLADARGIVLGRSDASFALRHTTLMAIAAMQNEIALDLLEEVALNPQPLPPKDPPGDPEGPDVEERVQHDMLALDALDGITALAGGGSREALDRLVAGAARGSRAVALAAIAALGSRGEWKEQHARARAALPAHHRDLAGARYADVREVPQIQDPRSHLIGTEQGGPKAPSIDSDVRSSASSQESVAGAPRVYRESDNG